MNTAETLTRAAGDLMLQHPHLSPSRAYQIALERDPALAARHHRGDPGTVAAPAAPAAPSLVDPGAALLAICRERAVTFQEACRRAPRLAAAWHRGEMIAASEAPAAPPVALPAVVRFRAPLAGKLGGTGLKRVAIFRAGTWNGRRYGASDLAAMVRAFEAGHYPVPLSLGHDVKPDAPAAGRVERLWIEGETLFADFANVAPDVLDGIADNRWLSLSCEVYLNFSRAGTTYPAALRSIAILGSHPPGVDLPPLLEALA